jgi:hypothetical protein
MVSSDKCDSNKVMLETVLQVLTEKYSLQESEADVVLQEHLKYVSEVVAEQRSRFLSISGDRIDVLSHDTVAGCKENTKLHFC